MGLKSNVKMLLRSRSPNFVRRLKQTGRTGQITFKGRPVYYRSGSSDMTLIHDILLYPGPKAEYWLPEEINPSVILDIGANIGIAAVYLANRFPEARIFSFEPMPDNFALLEKNTAPYSNIKAFNMALGRETCEMHIQTAANQTNFGGASLHNVDVDPETSIPVQVCSPFDFLRENYLTGADLIKIDTEGAEYDILTAMDREVLFKVKWIIGELHGVKDFALLDYLSEGFHLDVRKTLNKRYFRFNACNKNLVDSIPKDAIKWLQY